MKTLFAILVTTTVLTQPSTSGWDIFAKVKFTPQLVKEVNEYFLIPFFDSKIRFYEGKEMTLEGYVIPMDLESTKTIVLSKNPYSLCFFCGGACPESVPRSFLLRSHQNSRRIKSSKSRERLS